MTESTRTHRNDIYGDLTQKNAEKPATPAATVVLLREREGDFEVLMLKKTSKIAFGGMWVFPGGRIDPEDQPANGDADEAARNAAAREAKEETGLSLEPSEFVWFSHWTPPASTPVRFATWFFLAQAAGNSSITVDGGEIERHRWIAPSDALQRHAAGEIDLVPPTWVTLHQLSKFENVADVFAVYKDREVEFFETHVAVREDGVRVAMWKGDVGYEGFDADLEGQRHRLVMAEDGFTYQRDSL